MAVLTAVCVSITHDVVFVVIDGYTFTRVLARVREVIVQDEQNPLRGILLANPFEAQTFPDYLLTFGEFWNHTGAYPIDQDHVIDVGFPYLDRCKRTYADVESTDQILFMSQWMIAPGLSKFAVELSEQLGTDRDIVYKLHPDEYENWQRLYPWLAESGIEVAGPDGRTLHRLLAESGVQVAVYSTTIFEGLSYGLDTYLVELPGVEHMAPLIERGDATLVDSPERLNEELRDSRDGSGTKPDFFRENSLNRVCEVIRDLQKGGNE